MDSRHKEVLRLNLDLAISSRSLIDVLKMHKGKDDPEIQQRESTYKWALNQVVDIIAGDL